MANKNTLIHIRQAAAGRRHSVLPPEAAQELQEIDSAWDIATLEQLNQWVEEKPDHVLKFMNDIRFERDQCMEVALSYDSMREKNVTMKKDLEDSNELASSLQDQVNDANQAAQDAKQRLQTLQSKIKEKPIQKAEEEEDSADEDASKTRKRSSKKEKSVKFPDSPIFTDGLEPTWESWSYAVEEKLRINADHYPLDEDKVAYVIGRTSGKANMHTIVRKRKDALRPYRVWTDVLEHLASTFEDTNRLAIAKVEYRALQQNTSTFRAFFAEFMRLGSEIGKSDDDLKDDLREKVNNKLYDRLSSSEYSRNRGSLKDLKEFFIHYDDSGRTRSLQESTEKKTKTTIPATTRKATTYVLPARRSTTITTGTGATTSQARNVGGAETPDVTCYRCGKPNHIARDCPDPPTEAGKAASKAARAHAISMDEEFDSQGLHSSSDSGNE